MDPFILREQFKVPRGANLSSASLSTSILPGQGVEDAGKQAGAAFKKLNEISLRRQSNKMSLRASENSRKMGSLLIHAYKELEVEAQKNPETGEYAPLRKADGTVGTYDEVWAERSGKIRDSFLTGNDNQDNPFLKQSAAMFQNFAIRGTEASIDYERKQLIDTLTRTVTHLVNNIAERQKERNEGLVDNNIDIDMMQRNHYADTYAMLEDVNDLQLPPDDKNNLFLVVAERITEGYIDTLLRNNMWESAEEFIERGLKQKFGMGKDGSMFYVSDKRLGTIRDKIERIQSSLGGGLNSQLSHYSNEANALYKSGNTDQGDAAFAKFEELNTKSNRDPFFYNRALAERDTSIEFFKTSEALNKAPFADHSKLIIDFTNKNIGGLAGAYTSKLSAELNQKQELLLKAFKRSGADYVNLNVEAVRQGYLDATNEPDAAKRPALMQKAIKRSLESQENYLPGEKADILTIAQIEEFNDTFNQRSSNSKTVGLDGFHDQVKEFFRIYGDYGGAVLNELKDPTEGRDESSGITKLKSEIGIASIYGNTRIFNLIVGSTNDAKELKKMQWDEATADSARTELMLGVQKFYKSMGYAKFRDFGKSTMFNVAVAYNLGLTRQAGGLDPTQFVKQTLEDLIEGKWSSYENKSGGLFGINQNIKYLSIPKNDNEGNAYAHESASRALDNIRENPEMLGIPSQFEDSMKFDVLFKDVGVFINSGDGSGFRIGYVDHKQGDRITLLSDDVYSWDKFTAENYPKAFTYETTLSEDLSESAGDVIKFTKESAQETVSAITGGIDKLKSLKMPSKIENQTSSKIKSKEQPVEVNTRRVAEDLNKLSQAINYLASIGEDVGSEVRDFFKRRLQAHRSRQQRDRGY